MRPSASRASLALLLCLAACGQTREGQAPERGNGALEKGVHDILPLPPNAPERAELEGRSTPGPLVATLQGADTSSLKGTVRFLPTATGVELQSSIQALPTGPHALKVYTYGDCSDVEGGSAGPVLNLASLGGGEFAPYSAPKDRGVTEMDRQEPPGRTIYPKEPRVQADGAPVTPNELGPSNASPGFGPAPDGSPDAASSGASRTAGSTGSPPASAESAQAIQGSNELGEVVGVAEGSAEARQVLTQLTPGGLSQLVGRALVIYPAGNPEGEPLACGVIGVANQTSTANNQNNGSSGTSSSGTEGLAP